MNPLDLPQAELNVLTTALLEHLATGAGEHNRAMFHMDLEREPGRAEPVATRGGNLASTDSKSKGKPFVGGNLRRQREALVTASIRAGHPFFLLHYDFRRDPDGTWRYRLVVQSLAESEQMLIDRKPLDDALEDEMVRAVGIPWRRIGLQRSDLSPITPLQVMVFPLQGENFRLVIPTTIKETVDHYWMFYRERGFGVRSVTFGVEGGPLKREREVDVYYGAIEEEGSVS